MLTIRIEVSQTVSTFMSICIINEIKDSGIGNTSTQAKEQAACKL